MPMIRARSLRRAASLGLLALVALPACVSAPSDASSLNGGRQLVQRSDADLVSATVSLAATTLERGQNDFLIELQPTQDSGSVDSGSVDGGSVDGGSVDSGSVDGGSVHGGSVHGGSDVPVLTSATATMPAHGHSVTATSITQDGTVYRVNGLDLFMSGLWQVDLAVELGASSDHVEFSLDVP
jgi:hypothetical protein